MTTMRTEGLLGLAFSICLAACNAPSSGAAEGKAAGAPQSVLMAQGQRQVAPAASSAGGTVPVPAKVAKIVFVGKEHACECTRKAIESGWAALEQAVGTDARLKIERLHIDTEGDKVEPYRRQKPMMALPALYLLDERNTVLGLLQGEVSPQQITEAIIAAKNPRP